MAYYNRTRIEKVAEAISDLRYTEVQTLSTKLMDILTDRDVALDVRSLADLLADWAQSVEDEFDARLKEKAD